MGAISSFPRALSGLTRNPILLVLVGLIGAVQFGQLALQSINPLVGMLLSLVLLIVYVFFIPFYMGGILGMANEAIDGKTTIDSFLSEGKSNYVSLLAAYLVFAIVNVIVFVVGFIGFAVLSAFAIGLGSGPGTTGTASAAGTAGSAGAVSGVGMTGLLLVFGITGLGFLLYMLVVWFFQFYAHAIVLDDASFVEGFKWSFGLVRRNLLSVIGYSLIVSVGGVIIGIVSAVASIAFSLQDPAIGIDVGLPLLVGGAVVYVLAIAVGGAFLAIYSVSFYRDIRNAAMGAA